MARRQYGSKNIVSVTDPDRIKTNSRTDKTGTLQFWRDRLRKYARLATPETTPVEFSDQVDDYLKQQGARSLARVKAEKAKRQLSRSK